MTNACQGLPIYRQIPWTIDWLSLSLKVLPFICNCRQEVVVLKWAIERCVHLQSGATHTHRKIHTCLHPQSIHVKNEANTHPCTAVVTLLLQPVWPRIAHRLHSSALPPHCLSRGEHTADWWVTWTKSDLGDLGEMKCACTYRGNTPASHAHRPNR